LVGRLEVEEHGGGLVVRGVVRSEIVQVTTQPEGKDGDRLEVYPGVGIEAEEWEWEEARV
jgi:hypothetical protein